jgi:hypothetical protein
LLILFRLFELIYSSFGYITWLSTR